MRLAFAKILLPVALVFAGGAAQAPLPSKLKRVLVLDKNQNGANGHLESRRDFMAALRELATEKGFAITHITQNDPASKIDSEFSNAGLAAYQAVIPIYNDGIHEQLGPASKAALEFFVKDSGGLVMIHSAQDFITGWPWITGALVEAFYGPHGTNQPTADLAHDIEGTVAGTETRGLFSGLTAPSAFQDEYYSFRASPRGRPGVTILATVDEKTFSKPIQAPMGADHPVVWTKQEGLGHVINFSLGHSWSTHNTYAAKDAYLKRLLYGVLRYVAGDFSGCTDDRFVEYNPEATRSVPDNCKSRLALTVAGPDGGGGRIAFLPATSGAPPQVSVLAGGPHEVALRDISGRTLHRRRGTGPAAYSLPMPSAAGIYWVVGRAGGRDSRYRWFRP
jgi:uncharacterized protein